MLTQLSTLQTIAGKDTSTGTESVVREEKE